MANSVSYAIPRPDDCVAFPVPMASTTGARTIRYLFGLDVAHDLGGDSFHAVTLDSGNIR